MGDFVIFFKQCLIYHKIKNTVKGTRCPLFDTRKLKHPPLPYSLGCRRNREEDRRDAAGLPTDRQALVNPLLLDRRPAQHRPHVPVLAHLVHQPLHHVHRWQVKSGCRLITNLQRMQSGILMKIRFNYFDGKSKICNRKLKKRKVVHIIW